MVDYLNNVDAECDDKWQSKLKHNRQTKIYEENDAGYGLGFEGQGPK